MVVRLPHQSLGIVVLLVQDVIRVLVGRHVGTATSTVTCAARYYGAGGTVAQGSISKNRGRCTAPRTSPALNVKVGDKVFYGAMSTALTSKLKVKDIDNKTYSVVNDYQ